MKKGLTIFFISMGIILIASFFVLYFSIVNSVTKSPKIEYTLNEDNSSYTVSCKNEYIKSATIKEEYKGLPVTKIGNFKCMVQSINIPSSIIEIEDNAFNGCSRLYRVILHDNLKRIGNQAFFSCSSLREISIPSTVDEIGSYAFANCYKVLDLDLSNVKTIGEYAFLNTWSFSKVSTPKEMSVLETGLFMHSRLEEVTIDSSVTEIKDSCFKECARLEKIVIPKSVTKIGSNAFSLIDGDSEGIDLIYLGTIEEYNLIDNKSKEIMATFDLHFMD